MNIRKTLTNLVKSTTKVTRQPKRKVVDPDEGRITRELEYSRRIRQTSPRLKTLDERRIQAHQRRSLRGR